MMLATQKTGGKGVRPRAVGVAVEACRAFVLMKSCLGSRIGSVGIGSRIEASRRGVNAAIGADCAAGRVAAAQVSEYGRARLLRALQNLAVRSQIKVGVALHGITHRGVVLVFLHRRFPLRNRFVLELQDDLVGITG